MTEKTVKKAPCLKIGGIVSIVESGIMLLIVLLGLLMSGWLITMITGAEMAGAELQGMGMIKTVIMISLLVSAVLYILQIVGASKAMKLKKGGYIMYLVVAGLLSALLVLGLVQNFSVASLVYLIIKLVLLGLVVMGFKKSQA